MININGEEVNYLGYFDIPHRPEVGSYFINVEDNKLYRCDDYDRDGRIMCRNKCGFKWFKKSDAREIVITTYGTFLTRLVFPINIACHIAKNNLTEIDIVIPKNDDHEEILFKLGGRIYSSLTAMLYHAWYVWDMDYDKMVSDYGCSLSQRHYNTDAKSLYEGQLMWSIKDCNSEALLSPFLRHIGVHFDSVRYTKMFDFKYKKYTFFERFVANPLPIDEDGRIFYDLENGSYNRTIRSRVINDYELAELTQGCQSLEEALQRLSIPADEFRYTTKSYKKMVRQDMEANYGLMRDNILFYNS